MRTGNAFWALTFRTPGEPECRLTLLDAGEEAVAELAIPEAPWEESASVPVEAMSAFRTAVEELPERWAAQAETGDALVVTGSFDISGQKTAFEGRYARPEDVPRAHRRMFAAVATAALEALQGARSRHAVERLAAWGDPAA